MADGEQVVEQEEQETSTESEGQEDITEARAMGWCPKEEWRGKPEAWVTAKEFLEKGRVMLPMVQKENRTLREQQRQDRAQLATLSAELRNVSAALRAVQDQQGEDLKARVEDLREGLVADIAQAAKDGDHDKHAELLSKLIKLNTADRKAGGEGDPEGERHAREEAPQPHPDYLTWLESNPWFGQDKKRSRLATVAAQNVKDEEPTLQGKAFFSAVDAELARLEKRDRPARGGESRVAGGGSSGAGGSSGSTFSDLPADARAACEEMSRELVGKGKRFGTKADWQKAYARSYFEQEKR